MSGELGLKTAVCEEYERLLEESGRALKNWNEERAVICQSGAYGRDVDLSLLRGQAKYAKAYARLQRHLRECTRCQLVASMAECDEQRAAGPEEQAEVILQFVRSGMSH